MQSKLRRVRWAAPVALLVVATFVGGGTAIAAKGEREGLKSKAALAEERQDPRHRDTKDGYTKSVTVTVYECGVGEVVDCDPQKDPDRVRSTKWETNGPTPGSVPIGKTTQEDRRPKTDKVKAEPLLTGTADPMPTEAAIAVKENQTAGCSNGKLCAQGLTYGHNYNFHWLNVDIDYGGDWQTGCSYGVTFWFNWKTGFYGNIYAMNGGQFWRYYQQCSEKGPVYGLFWNHYTWAWNNPYSGFRAWKAHQFQGCPTFLPCGRYYYPEAHFYAHGDGSAYTSWKSN